MKIKNFILKKGKLRVNINDIEFSQKGIYILKGNNGAGKTSFIETILKENDYMDIEDKESNIAYFSQQLYKYSISGRKYVKTNNMELLNKYCKMFGVDYLDKNILQISGGEFVKLAIIRCLIKDTPILIFDEPTNNLDDAATETVQMILNELSKSKTIIVSTHDKRLQLDYYKEYSFENGEVIKRSKENMKSENVKYIESKIRHKNNIFGTIFSSKFNKLMFCLIFILLIAISIFSVNYIKYNVYLESDLKSNNYIEILDIGEFYASYIEATVSQMELQSKYANKENHFDTHELIRLSSKDFVKKVYVADQGYINELTDALNTESESIHIIAIPNIITDSPNYQRTYPGGKGFLILGRLPEDNESEVVVSYEQMQKHWDYTGDINDIIGNDIEINDKGYEIVGVTNLPVTTISYENNSDTQYGFIEANINSEAELDNSLKKMETQGYEKADLYYRNVFIEYDEGSDQELMNILVQDAPSYQYYSNFVNDKIMLYTYKNTIVQLLLIALSLTIFSCGLMIIVGKRSFIIIDDYIKDINNVNFKPKRNIANLYKVLFLDFLIILPIIVLISYIYLRTNIGLLMMLPSLGMSLVVFSCALLILRKVNKRNV